MVPKTILSDLQRITEEQDEEVLSEYLRWAEQVVLNRLYPFGYDEGTKLPARYYSVCERIAVYFYNKDGAEGEKVHLENGIHRHYETGDVPPTLLTEITPYVSIF